MYRTLRLLSLSLFGFVFVALSARAQDPGTTGRTLEPRRLETASPDPNVRPAAFRIDPDSGVVFQTTTPREPYVVPEGAASKNALGWIPILQEDFENVDAFLNRWARFRISPSADVYWFTSTLRARTGTRSAWGAGDGLDANPASGQYPNNTHSWLQYGPFDLTGMSQARLSFFRSVQTPTAADRLFWGVSTDGVNFSGFEASGSETTWREDGLNLNAYVGQTQVWIAFVFRSDADGQVGAGAFVDDVLLEKNDDPFPPETPVPLSPADGAVNQLLSLTLDWNDPVRASTYNLQVSTASNFSTTITNLSGLTSSSYALEGLTRATTYYWRVRAAGVGGTSAWSSTFRFTTIPQPPPAPALVSPANGAVNVTRPVALDWSDVSGASTYQVQVSTSNGFASTVIDQSGLAVSAFSATTLSAGTRYYWRARAANAWESGPWSETRSFTTLPEAPPAPAPVEPPSGATFVPPTVTLDWTDSPRATSYRAQGSLTDAFGTLLFDSGDVPVSQFTVAGLADATTYFWRARAANVGGTSPWSTVASFLTAWPDTVNIPAPSLSSPATDAVNQALSLSLIWNPIPGESVLYDVQLATNPGFAPTLIDRPALSVTQTDVSGLVLNTSYFWRVRARIDTLESAWSVRQFTTLPPPPAAPGLVSPTAGAVDVAVPVTLTWNSVSGAGTYDLQVSTSAGFSPLLVDDPGLVLISYTLSTLAAGTAYHWRVRSVGPGGTSVWSTARSFTTLPDPPAAPTLLAPADGANNVTRPVALDWSDAARATTYEVQISPSDAFSPLVVNQTGLTASAYSATTLAAGTLYYWRVRARNSGGASAWTPARAFRTLPDPPGTPTLVTPANGAIDRSIPVTLDWTNVATTETYQAQVSTRSDFATTVLDASGIPFSIFSASGLSLGTTYYWRVRSVNAGGTSAWTAPWSFTTLPLPPPAPSLASPANAAVNLLSPILLDWSDVTGATSYRVQVATIQDFSQTLVNRSALTTSSFSFETTLRGTTFYWRVRGANSGGEGAWSSTRSFTTMPPPPIAPTLLSPANQAINVPRPVALDWSDVANATSHQLQLNNTGDFSAPLLDQSGLTSSAYSATSLSAGTTYYWRVRSTGIAGTSSWTGTNVFTTLPDPPPATSLLTPLDNAANLAQPIRLTWSSLSSAASYTIQIATASDFASPVINQSGVGATFFDAQGLARGSGTLHYWRVRGVNAGGAGPWSPVFRFTTIPDPPPAPALLTPANGAQNLTRPIALDWSDAARATSYRIQISPVPEFWMISVDQSGLTSSQYTATTLMPGEFYYWRVSATNAGGTGPWSESRTFTTLPDPPLAPVLLAPLSGATGVPRPVAFDWADSDGATAYRIQVATSSEFIATAIDQSNVTASMYSATTLVAGTAYFWRVRASNIAGAGPWSEVRSFSTISGVPPAPTPSDPPNGATDQSTALTLDWSDVSGATSYQAQVSTSQTFTTVQFDSGTLTTSQYSVSGLGFSTTYYWRARAANAAGPGAWSEVRSFTTSSQDALPAPGLSAPSDGALNQPTTLTLLWNAVSGTGVTYDAQVATSNAFATLVLDRTALTTTQVEAAGLERSTTYFWRVRAKDATRTGAWSSARQFTTIPPPPPAPMLTSPANGAVDVAQPVALDWNDVQDASSYEVHVSSNASFTSLAASQAGITTSSFTSPTLTAGTLHYWRVRSSGIGGTGDWSVVRTFTTRPLPPTAPTLVSPADGTADLAIPVALDWTDVAGASSYDLHVSTVQTFSSFVINETGLAVSAYSATSLQPGSVYYWRARAVNSGGASPWTAVRVFSTLPDPPTVAPALLAPAANAVDQAIPVTLDWGNVSGASSYQVQVATQNTFAAPVVDAAGLVFSIFSADALVRGTQYFWRARAANSGGAGPWSEVRSFATIPVAAAAPTLIAPANAASDVPSPVLLDWSDVAGATTYRVQVATTAAFSQTVADVSSLTSSGYSFDTAARATTFYWRASALNAGGASPWSETRSFTTLPNPPAAPDLLSPANAVVDLARPVALDWTDVAGATSYRVQVSAAADFSASVIDQAGLAVSAYSATSLQAGRLYYWRARAVNPGGEGAWSASRTFSTLPDVPAAPTLVSPAAGATNQPVNLTLDWQDTPGAASYQAQLATSADFSSGVVVFGNLTSSQASAEGLAHSTTYSWRARATNAAGTGPWSAVRSFTTAAPGMLTPPSLRAPSNGAVDRPVGVILEWNAVGTGSATYELQVSLNDAFNPVAQQLTGITATQSGVPGLSAGTTYYWRVRAKEGAQTSDWSVTWRFTTAPPPPPAPALVSPAGGASGLKPPVALSWSSVAGATTYRLQLSTRNDFASSILDLPSLSATSYAVETLQPGTTYFWHVRGANSGGEGPWSEVRSFGTAPAAPSAPTLVSPADAATGLKPPVALDWSDVAGAVSYEVQVAATPAFSPVLVARADLIPSAFTVNALDPGATFYWRVRATNTGGSGPWSSIRSFATAPPPPPAPSLVFPADAAVDLLLPVTLDWSDVSGATGYQVQVSTTADFGSPRIDESGLSVSALTARTLSTSTVYFWRARATNAGGAGPWSSTQTFTTAPPPPGAPGLTAPAPGAQDLTPPVQLDWADVPGAASYRVQIAPTADFAEFAVNQGGLTVSAFTVESLAAGATWYWRAQAMNVAGAGAWSVVRSFTTRAAVPPPPVLLYPGDGAADLPVNLTLDWKDSPGASTYEAVLSTDPGFASTVAAGSGLTESQFTVSGLTSSTVYYWRARAASAGGVGEWSATWSFSTAEEGLLAGPSLASPPNNAVDQPTTVQFVWSAVGNGEIRYQFQLAANASFSSPVADETGLAALAFEVSGLSAGIDYYWRVRATDGTRVTGWSTVWHFTTMAAPPGAPTPLSPTQGAIGLIPPIVLEWSEVSGADSYAVQLASDSAFENLILEQEDLTLPTFLVETLGVGETLYWRVRAHNAAGAGPWSAVRSFTTRPAPPAAPTLVSPSDGAPGLSSPVSLTWNGVEGASVYRVQVAASPEFSVILVDAKDLSTTTFSAVGLAPGQTFHWRVRASNAGGPGPWSAVRSFSTTPSAPGVPFLTAPANGAADVVQPVTLGWTEVAGAASYRVQLSAQPGFGSILVDESAPGTSFSVSGRPDGQLVYWRVRAENAGGVGPWSNVSMFSTLPPLPAAPDLVTPAEGAVDQAANVMLDWQDVLFADRYHVQLSPVASFATRIVDQEDVLISQFGVDGLEGTGPFFWRVRAGNARGVGAWSAARSFTVVAPGGLGVPSLVSPANGSSDRLPTLTLYWKSVGGGAVRYEVQVARSEDFASPTFVATDLATLVIEPTGLQRGSTYYWRVRAADGTRTSSWSAVWRFATLSNPPEAPVLLSPEDGSGGLPTDLTLTWNELAGASTYRLQVSSSPEFSEGLLSDIIGLRVPAYTLSALSPGTTYYWRVLGVNAGGEGSWSAPSRFTTTVPAPRVPVLLGPGNGTTAVAMPVVLTWEGLAEATSYHLLVAVDEACSAAVVNVSGLTSPEFTIEDLAFDTVYFWRVQAVNDVGLGPWSNTWSFRTEASSVDTEDGAPLPLETRLLPNYPNPFNPATIVPFELAERSTVTLTVYDILGRPVTRLLRDSLPAGSHQVVWRASGVASGTYFVVLTAGDVVAVRKVVVVR